MGKAFIIARKDIKEAFRSKSTYFYILFLFLIMLPYFTGFRDVINTLSKQGLSSKELQLAGQSFVDTLVYTVPLLINMLFCSFLSAYAIIMDKAKRTLESLLATPASLRQIWLGKALAVALPSVVISLLVSLLALLVLNIVVAIPTLGSPILPSALPLVAGFLIVPVTTFFVVALVSFLQLIMANPRIANFAFIVLFLGIYMSTITELTKSWDFSLIYLVVTALLAAVTVFVARFLTKERVILSSKG